MRFCYPYRVVTTERMTFEKAYRWRRRLHVTGIGASVIILGIYGTTHWPYNLWVGAPMLVVNVAGLALAEHGLTRLLEVRTPVNVRLVVDGEPVPVECVYIGFDGNRHEWQIIRPAWLDDGENVYGITADVVPAYSAIAWRGP
jgi:hypothetical protein